jgi:hypothetical protein
MAVDADVMTKVRAHWCHVGIKRPPLLPLSWWEMAGAHPFSCGKTLDFVQTILRFLAAETVLGRGGA